MPPSTSPWKRPSASRPQAISLLGGRLQPAGEGAGVPREIGTSAG